MKDNPFLKPLAQKVLAFSMLVQWALEHTVCKSRLVFYLEKKSDLIRRPVHFESPYTVIDVSSELAARVWCQVHYFGFKIHFF